MYTVENNDVFEKISIRDFDLTSFSEACLSEREVEDYGFRVLGGLDAIWIEWLLIKEEHTHQGHGSRVIQELKKHNKPIIVYALFQSIEFWEKHGFESILEHEYVHMYVPHSA